MKKAVESKTLWFNTSLMVLSLLVVGLDAISEHPTLPAYAAPYILLVQNAINMVLRFATSKPITLK